MKKRKFPYFHSFLLLSLLFFMCQLMIPSSHKEVGNPPYLWTRHFTGPWYLHTGNGNPIDDYQSTRNFNRYEFGFPYVLLVVDNDQGTDVWYAKLDLKASLFLLALAMVLSVAILNIYRLYMITHKKTATTQ